MQTFWDVKSRLAGLLGDPQFDWLTDDYVLPLCNQAYDQSIVYLQGTCSPFIEKTVVIPSVTIGQDESNLVPFAVGAGNNKTYPLKDLMEPRFVDFKPAGSANCFYKPVTECQILPDTSNLVTPVTVDIRVRGDFRPAPLTTDDSIIEVHPLAAHALAFATAAVIGMERPNDGWVKNYGPQGENAWDQIAAKLVTQQQRLTYRIGSPNRADTSSRRNQWNLNLQGNLGWEWRSFQLYVKLI
jgi:hypothetical protein